MRVALVFPSNILHAPYVNYYLEILKEHNIDYDLINWDRFGIDETGIKYSFRSISSLNSGNVKKFIEYYKFSRYSRKVIKRNEYDKLIIFIPQLAIFLKRFLIKHYKNRYIFDIRDFSKSGWINYKLEKVISNSYFTSLSSKGYELWLPKSDKYLLSHNISKKDLFAERHIKEPTLSSSDPVIVSNIGVIRDYSENREVIRSLGNNQRYVLNFIGRGVDEDKLKQYCDSGKINNVKFLGSYKKNEEMSHYESSDIINLIRSSELIGSKTSIANRLYNAALSKRPVIVSSNTLMSDIVETYRLGLSVNLKLDSLADSLENFILKFDSNDFARGCEEFLESIEDDYHTFSRKLTNFLMEKQ